MHIFLLTVSGMYRSGMTILSGTPNRLSIIRIDADEGETTFSHALSSLPSGSPSLLRAERITSGGEWFPGDFNVCSRSKSSRDRAPSCITNSNGYDETHFKVILWVYVSVE